MKIRKFYIGVIVLSNPQPLFKYHQSSQCFFFFFLVHKPTQEHTLHSLLCLSPSVFVFRALITSEEAPVSLFGFVQFLHDSIQVVRLCRNITGVRSCPPLSCRWYTISDCLTSSGSSFDSENICQISPW